MVVEGFGDFMVVIAIDFVNNDAKKKSGDSGDKNRRAKNGRGNKKSGYSHSGAEKN